MKKILLLIVIGAFLFQCMYAQTIAQPLWPSVKKEMRPWTRWWWMGSAVDEKNLDYLLTAYQQAGIGGVEITPIYGAKGYENRYIDFLSPTWVHMLKFTVEKASSLGMGVDMNTGTGWPFGGPQITKELAASKIIITQPFKATAGQKLSVRLAIGDTTQQRLGASLQALTAINEQGERISILDKINADHQLEWTPVDGNWTIYAAFSGKTGQLVKRAAPGGEGFVMDHYTKKPVETYLKRFTDSFHGNQKGVDAFFNDSYEVYGANWSPEFFDTFKQLKGYDLRLFIMELAGNDSSDLVARIKCDYNEVLGHMLLHNFTKPWVEWAHLNGAKAKNQAHGSPGNLLDLYGAADIPECEAYFGISKFLIPELKHDKADFGRDNVEHNPIFFKFASSAAHFYGKPLTSAETFVWQTEHFRTAFSRCKPEVEQLFLAGINHVYFHGSTYSPEDIPWPGWTFYASTNFVPANSTWPHLKGMNDYITRCQSVLQAGNSDNQLMVYWPVYDQWNDPKGMEKLFAINAVDGWLNPTLFNKLVKNLEHAGYSTDFVSDQMIDAAAKNGTVKTTKVLVIPNCHFMPVETLENILNLAKKGATVIFQNLPEDVPGYADFQNKRLKFKELLAELSFNTKVPGISRKSMGAGELILAPYLPDGLQAAKIQREELTDLGLQFIRRDLGDGKYYYIVNHTTRAVDAYIPLNVKPGAALIMDPQDGKYGRAQTIEAGGKMKVRIQCESGEAFIIRTFNNSAPSFPAWSYLGNAETTQTINGEWSLHFTNGGPELPADQKINQLKSWTLLDDSKAVSFSGSGVYTTTFNMPSLSANEYLLHLGKVSESAHVWINGNDAGFVWSLPFRIKVKNYLKQGTNTLKIEVANLMANRIRDMDQKGIQWRNYHEINFVNIKYKAFDASGWESLPSGLMGPVTITALTQDRNVGLAPEEWQNGLTLQPHGSINQQELDRQYKAHKDQWDKAFNFLKQPHLDILKPGRYQLDGDKVFATVSEDPSKYFEKSEWESHRQYSDIQYVIRGKELIGVAPFAALTVREPYNVKRDVIFWNDLGEGYYYEANPQTFFVFFPEDAHRPNILADGYNVVKKIVVKIKTDYNN